MSKIKKTNSISKFITKFSSSGGEINDPTPRSLSTGIKRPPTQEQRLKRLMMQHQQQMAEDQEYVDETDFDIDEPDMLSMHEKAAFLYEMEPVQPTPKEEEQNAPQNAGDAPPPSSDESED